MSKSTTLPTNYLKSNKCFIVVYDRPDGTDETMESTQIERKSELHT